MIVKQRPKSCAAPAPGLRRSPAVLTWAAPSVPAFTALIVGLWRVGTPSLWRDEAVTISAAQRPLGDMFRLLSNVDAVHGAYYVLMRPVVDMLGTSELALRLLSVLAAAVAAGLTAALGRRLATPGVGLCAGLMVALSPTVSRFAQEARQYELAMALAVAATSLFVRALDQRARTAFLWYGMTVVALGLIHLFTLLLLPAHAVTVWRSVGGDRALVRRWAVTVLIASITLAPMLFTALPQKGQVEWITRPGTKDLVELAVFLTGAEVLVLPVLVLLAVGLWRTTPRPGRIDLRWVALPWLVVPPALLLGVSLIQPYYLFRYVLFCVPAVALLTGAGLSRIRWTAVPAGLVLAALSVPTHMDIRKETSRSDDLRKLAGVLRENKRPGDAIVFHHTLYRRVTAAYPDAYEGLRDIALRTPPIEAATLMGVEVIPSELTGRLSSVDRMWFVSNRLGYNLEPSPEDQPKDDAVRHSHEFRRAGRWPYRGGVLYLYEHR